MNFYVCFLTSGTSEFTFTKPPFVVSWKRAKGASVLSTQRITFPCSLQQEATCGHTPNPTQPSLSRMHVSFILGIIMSNIQTTPKICVKEERGGAARRVSRLKPACLLIKILKLSATFVPWQWWYSLLSDTWGGLCVIQFPRGAFYIFGEWKCKPAGVYYIDSMVPGANWSVVK